MGMIISSSLLVPVVEALHMPRSRLEQWTAVRLIERMDFYRGRPRLGARAARTVVPNTSTPPNATHMAPHQRQQFSHSGEAPQRCAPDGRPASWPPCRPQGRNRRHCSLVSRALHLRKHPPFGASEEAAPAHGPTPFPPRRRSRRQNPFLVTAAPWRGPEQILSTSILNQYLGLHSWWRGAFGIWLYHTVYTVCTYIQYIECRCGGDSRIFRSHQTPNPPNSIPHKL